MKLKICAMNRCNLILFEMCAILLLVGQCAGTSSTMPPNKMAPTTSIMDMDVLKVSKLVLKGCKPDYNQSVVLSNPPKVNFSNFGACLKTRLLRAMDLLLKTNVIELPFGLTMVKDPEINQNQDLEDNENVSSSVNSPGFLDATVTRAARFLRTHSLRIPLPRNVSFDHFFEGNTLSRQHPFNLISFEGRRRNRHKNDMMGLMLFGVMAMSVIAIPLGFQFLAVLGGKALMLAKLALILTSIQGLKKIATSNLSYGLYHSPHTRPWHYDRRWQPTHADAEQAGLFDGFDSAGESPGMDDIRPRIMLPRISFAGHHRMPEQPRD